LKKTFGVVFTFILAAAFLFFALRGTDLQDLAGIISNASLPFMFLFITFFLSAHVVRALRWRYIVASQKEDVSFLHALGGVLIGYGVNCVVPRLGEVYRSFFIGHWEKLSRSAMLGTVVVERIIDIVSLALSILISVLIFPGNLFEEVTWLKPTLNITAALMVGVIILMILIVKFKEKFYGYIVKFIEIFTHKYAEKIGGIFKTFAEGFGALQGRKNYFMTFFWTVVIMLLYGFNAYVGFYMLRINEVYGVTLSMGWILMTISAFGVIIPTPGGTGSYHLLVIFVMTALFGIARDLSVAYAVLTHFISYSLFIILMFVIYGVINYVHGKKGLPKENFFSVLKRRVE